jgi:YVTN family beta-propeller protein
MKTDLPTQRRDPLPASTRTRLRRERELRRRRAFALAILLLLLVPVTGGLLRVAGVLGASHAPSHTRASEPAGGGRGRAVAASHPPAGHGAPSGPVRHFALRITSHPAGAAVTVTGPAGGKRSGLTPFKGTFPSEQLTLTLAARGHNRLTQRVTLDRARSLDLWLDPSGLLLHKLGEFETGSNPKQVAFTPDERQIWVTDLGGRGVQVFDARTLRLIKDIDLKQGAVEVIFDRAGTTAFVSQMQTASVFLIDTATLKVEAQIFTKGVWSKEMALSPDEKTLYVVNWSSDNVSEIDLASRTVRRVIPTVHTPRGVYPTADGTRLYVAGFGTGDIARIDLDTGTSSTVFHSGGAMRHLVGDPKKGLLYADDMALGQVFVLDLRNDQVRKLANTDHTPNTLDLSPDGRVLYVSCRGRNNPTSYYLVGPEWGSVVVIDTATGRELDAIVGGNQPTGLDVSPDGRLLAYSDFLDNRVSVFSIPPYSVYANGHGGRSVSHLADLEK